MPKLSSRFGCELQPDIQIENIVSNPLLTSLSSSASANVKGIEQTVKISQLKSNYFLTLGNTCYKTIIGGDLLVKSNAYFFGNLKLYNSNGYMEFPDGTQQTTAFIKSEVYDKITEKINVEVVNRIRDVDQETFDRINAVEQEVIARQNAISQEVTDRIIDVNQEMFDRIMDVEQEAAARTSAIHRIDTNIINIESKIERLYQSLYRLPSNIPIIIIPDPTDDSKVIQLTYNEQMP